MPKKSSGLLMFREGENGFEVLLVHPGGPLYAKKDEGCWAIPKGEFDDEDPLEAAIREFHEETHFDSAPPYLPLGPIRQKGGKEVHAWAFSGDCDPSKLESDTFEMEWPPRSGRERRFPEVDRAAWFTLEEARRRILPSQADLLDRLVAAVDRSRGAP